MSTKGATLLIILKGFEPRTINHLTGQSIRDVKDFFLNQFGKTLTEEKIQILEKEANVNSSAASFIHFGVEETICDILHFDFASGYNS